MQLSQGEVSVGVGGGLCKLANLIHGMGLHTPLELVERHHHSFDRFPEEGRVLPFGTGASLFFNDVDLRFRNPTNQTLQLLVWLDDSFLRGEIRAERPPALADHVLATDHRFEQDGSAAGAATASGNARWTGAAGPGWASGCSTRTARG